MLLSVTGGLLGLLVAQSVLKTVLATMAGNLPRAQNIALNAPVLFFVFALSIAVGIAFGLMPALRTSATDVHAALKAGGRGTTAGRVLVIVQVSFALILLTNVPFRIVCVVGHVKHYGLDDSVTEKPQIYYSFYQLPGDVVPVFRADVSLVVRTAADGAALLPAIRTAVSEVGGDQPVYNIHTMEELVSGSMSRQRLPMLLLVAFAALALLLALVGTYAVISYSTARRAHEIGIRMALGAAKRDILRMVLAQGLRLALAGVVAGASNVAGPHTVDVRLPQSSIRGSRRRSTDLHRRFALINHCCSRSLLYPRLPRCTPRADGRFPRRLGQRSCCLI